MALVSGEPPKLRPMVGGIIVEEKWKQEGGGGA